MNDDSALHIAVFPWLAMGHLIPFLQLSKCLAQKGHRVSFISTPRNTQRLPNIPPDLSHLINFVIIPLPSVEGLPKNAEASVDIPVQKSQLLKKAFDGLQPPVTTFLKNSAPDWIIYDYASHWLPGLAAELGLPSAYFSLFNAASLSFLGPPSAMIDNQRLTIEAFTVVPEWIPFPSNIAYRYHELVKFFQGAGENDSGVSDFVRFGIAVRDSDIVALRSCTEFEPEWITLLSQLYQKTVVPVGSLFPFDQVQEQSTEKNWVDISEWLNKQARESVVYVALGTEASLSREEVTELALGLELSKLPFFWVSREEMDMLPVGFKERTKEQGVIYTSWAPQVKILAHDSVGGFLTHCGWNSVVEGLGCGRPLILLPVLNDQGLNSRLLEGKRVGVEISRNIQDGSFKSESVAESLRTVVVSKVGEEFRVRAKGLKSVFADQDRMERYVDEFIGYLKNFRGRRAPSQSP